MSNKLFHILAQAEGFCCEDAYLSYHSNVSTSKLAKHLGLDRKSVLRQRNRLHRGETRCNGTCRDAKKLFQLYLTRARKEVSSSEVYLRVPRNSSVNSLIYQRAIDLWVEMYIEKTKELTGEKVGRAEAMKAFAAMGVKDGE